MIKKMTIMIIKWHVKSLKCVIYRDGTMLATQTNTLPLLTLVGDGSIRKEIEDD